MLKETREHGKTKDTKNEFPALAAKRISGVKVAGHYVFGFMKTEPLARPSKNSFAVAFLYTPSLVAAVAIVLEQAYRFHSLLILRHLPAIVFGCDFTLSRPS